MKAMPKSGEVRVGLGWVCATGPNRRSSLALGLPTYDGDSLRFVQRFLDMLFHRRDGRTAFDQCVHIEAFAGHFPDGSYTALETLSRLQAFVDEAEQVTIKAVAVQADQAFVRVERIAAGSAGSRQHLMQFTLTEGKIVDYFGSLES